jgi:hypothetical protein
MVFSVTPPVMHAIIDSHQAEMVQTITAAITRSAYPGEAWLAASKHLAAVSWLGNLVVIDSRARPRDPPSSRSSTADFRVDEHLSIRTSRPTWWSSHSTRNSGDDAVSSSTTARAHQAASPGSTAPSFAVYAGGRPAVPELSARCSSASEAAMTRPTWALDVGLDESGAEAEERRTGEFVFREEHERLVAGDGVGVRRLRTVVRF